MLLGIYLNAGIKKPNTDNLYIIGPNFGHNYSVFSLVLEVYKEM